MIVDLSVVLNDDTPVYPGDPKMTVKPALTLDKDGCNDHVVTIGTHVGTHMDAPMHMLPNAKSLDQYSVDHFVGRGVYVQMKDKKYDLELLKNIDIREGDMVLFHSGLAEAYLEDSYFEDYPAMPAEVAKYLADKKVKAAGMDMCSPDHEVFESHKILLAGDVLIIENLTNLEQLAGKEFTVYALPIKLQVDGAPARVIARIE